MRQIAIVLAAGRGKRMNSKVAKQYLTIQDKPVLYYSLKQFEDSLIDDIILVTAEEEIAYCREEIVEKYGFQKVHAITAGGKERYHSVYHGLVAAKNVLGCGEEACIYIHDGARPLINEEILLRAKESVEKYGSGVVGMPVKDTIKLVDEDGFVTQTPKRSCVWQVQTPQCFLFSDIMAAYEKLMQQETALLEQGVAITDDAMVMELLGEKKVKLVEGSYANIKITTPEDMSVAEQFMLEQGIIK